MGGLVAGPGADRDGVWAVGDIADLVGPRRTCGINRRRASAVPFAAACALERMTARLARSSVEWRHQRDRLAPHNRVGSARNADNCVATPRSGRKPRSHVIERDSRATCERPSSHSMTCTTAHCRGATNLTRVPLSERARYSFKNVRCRSSFYKSVASPPLAGARSNVYLRCGDARRAAAHRIASTPGPVPAHSSFRVATSATAAPSYISHSASSRSTLESDVFIAAAEAGC